MMPNPKPFKAVQIPIRRCLSGISGELLSLLSRLATGFCIAFAQVFILSQFTVYSLPPADVAQDITSPVEIFHYLPSRLSALPPSRLPAFPLYDQR